MSTAAEVRLWGRTIGAVAMSDDGVADFEYTPEFADSGIAVAPLTMPPSRDVYRFPELARTSFQGLPGLLADSLPDRFGNAVIDAWLAAEGRDAASFDPVERLCTTGTRGMGALEYRPVLGPRARTASRVRLDRLVELASEILSLRDGLEGSLEDDDALRELLRIGTSAGGARAKAVVAWNPRTGEIRSGQVDADEGFEHWLLKFDGVSHNRDRELADPAGFGAIEYAYHLMAVAAGIHMMPCRLHEENGRRHFMTRRFDRPGPREKLHLQSLGAMAHLDYNLAGAHSYEQCFQVIRRLGLPMADVEEQYRRMVFNVLARNQDDHVKNVAFLMDKSGTWSLSPAFDLTYAYNPTGDWTSRHQMSVNGKRDGFEDADFETVARGASMKRGRWKVILGEVRDAVRRWAEFGETAGVEGSRIGAIAANLRVDPARGAPGSP